MICEYQIRFQRGKIAGNNLITSLSFEYLSNEKVVSSRSIDKKLITQHFPFLFDYLELQVCDSIEKFELHLQK